MERLQNILARVKQSRLFADSFWALCGSVLGKGMSVLAGIVVDLSYGFIDPRIRMGEK